MAKVNKIRNQHGNRRATERKAKQRANKQTKGTPPVAIDCDSAWRPLVGNTTDKRTDIRKPQNLIWKTYVELVEHVESSGKAADL